MVIICSFYRCVPVSVWWPSHPIFAGAAAVLLGHGRGLVAKQGLNGEVVGPGFGQAGGEVSGIVATPAARVSNATGLEYRWVATSFNRQLKIVMENRKQVCAIGWFKNPKREKFAKFTEAIYQNKPLIALGRVDNGAVAEHQTLRALMSDRNLKMAKKLGFSYGPVVDGLIDKLKPVSITTSQDNAGMIRMLIGRRFDYFISSPKEGERLIAALGIASEDIAMIEFRDLPPGNKRYIRCSQSVGDETIEKLNTAIRDTLS